MESALWIPVRPYSRLAVQAGRGSDPTAHGCKRSPLSKWRCRRSGPPIAGSPSPGLISFADRFEGQPLKGVAVSFGAHMVRGEAMVTRTGIEGGAIYALSTLLREAIASSGQATLRIALRADLDNNHLIAQLSRPRGRQSLSNFLRKAVHLPPAAIGLLQETAITLAVSLSSLSPAKLAGLINGVPIELNGVAPIARAISTAGGIAFSELDGDFMIRRLPGVFAAGEMLDWEAPTGGYLLQASFATGAAAGRGALKWLEKRIANGE